MSDFIYVISTFGKATLELIGDVSKSVGQSKDAASAVESAAKVIALVESAAKVIALAVGAWWTWKAFVRKRVRFPSAKVEHVIRDWTGNEIKFLRVTVRMTNNGNVLIRMGEGCTRIQQVTPVPEHICDALAAGQDPVQTNTTEFGWTLIQERDLNPAGFEIEPGESEEFSCDFTVPQSVSRVLVYSYLENAAKGGWWEPKKIGWQLDTLYEIPEPRKGIREWLTKKL